MMVFQVISTTIVEGGGRMIRLRNVGNTAQPLLYRTQNGSAVEGVDFVDNFFVRVGTSNGQYSQANREDNPSNFVIPPDGVAVAYIQAVDDSLPEGLESFTLFFRGDTDFAMPDQSQVITINDAVRIDAGSFSVADVTFAEGDTGSTPGQFVVTRMASAGTTLGAATVRYTIVDAGSSAQTTATFGSDYSASRSGVLTFGAGQTSATVPFTVIGDTIAEGNETFRLQLSSPSDSGTIARGVGTATIVDNDGTPPPVAPNTPGFQQGSSGNDVLISTNQGNSILAGGRGDDTYLVYAQGDRVVEVPNEGNDILYTTVSYSLGEAAVEAMSVAQQTTTNTINLIGNYVSQIIVGNYGDNVLNGGSGGVDTLVGLFGNDTYAVGDARTIVVEQTGQGFDTAVTSVSYTLGTGVSIEVLAAQDRASTTGLRLGGNEVSQTIAGTAGADTLIGGGGVDTLIGGAGADVFAFTTAPAAGSVSILADFAAGTDRIQLTTTAFSTVGATLDASEFVVGSAATTATQFVVFNQTTGQLFYDADGSGSSAAVLFAQLAPGTALTAASFDVVAPAATT